MMNVKTVALLVVVIGIGAFGATLAAPEGARPTQCRARPRLATQSGQTQDPAQ